MKMITVFLQLFGMCLKTIFPSKLFWSLQCQEQIHNLVFMSRVHYFCYIPIRDGTNHILQLSLWLYRELEYWFINWTILYQFLSHLKFKPLFSAPHRFPNSWTGGPAAQLFDLIGSEPFKPNSCLFVFLWRVESSLFFRKPTWTSSKIVEVHSGSSFYEYHFMNLEPAKSCDKVWFISWFMPIPCSYYISWSRLCSAITFIYFIILHCF